jgi:hypothetical protein
LEECVIDGNTEESWYALIIEASEVFPVSDADDPASTAFNDSSAVGQSFGVGTATGSDETG